MQKRLFRLEEGWLTLILLWGMLFVSTLAIVQTDLTQGMHIIPAIATIALLTGLLLAKSRFSTNTANFISLIYGLFVLTVLLGANMPQAEDLIWRQRVFDMIDRFLLWVRKAIDGGTSRDGYVFVMQTAAVYWLLGYTAAWFTFRTPRVWRVIIPTGIVLLSFAYYYTGPEPMSAYLAVFLLLSLIFVAQTHLVAQEKAWRAASVRYEKWIRFTFLRAGFLAALVALTLAWSLPTMTANAAVNDALSSAKGPWRGFQDNWTRLFSALRSYSAPVSDSYSGTLVLSGPRTVGSAAIMDVYVEEQLPYVYWQAIVYDTYENGRWRVAQDANTTLHFPDDGQIDVPDARMRKLVEQTVVTYMPNSSMLYAAPEIVASDKQMYVEARPDDSGKQLVTTARSRFILRQGDRYNVTSSVSTADADSLRAASTDYPDWVKERYLQVPDEITPETLALAEELTASYATVFDKAIVVRNYLRQNIAYNDQINAAPDGMEPVHYTLFVLKEAYCNYYASAMAIMLRSQGIPTRIVSGYAQGEFNEDTSSYRVRAGNAHTWVEVYFPEYGWIQFEPTASIPIVSRDQSGGNPGDGFDVKDPINPDERLENLLDVEELNPDDLKRDPSFSASESNQTAWQRFVSKLPVWQMVIGLLILAAAGGAIFSANSYNARVESDVMRSYGRLGNWAGWLGVLFRPALTPHERADLMTTAVPEGKAPIRNLTQQFVRRQFSPAHAPDDDFDARHEWKELRPILLRQAIVRQLQKLKRNRD